MERSVFHCACVFALGAGPLVGCTDVVQTVTLTVTTTEAPSFDAELGRGPLLEGVELCETDTTNCATTDATGAAQIDLPANQAVSYTVSKDGYGPYLAVDVTDETFRASTWPMLSDALLTDNAAALGIEYPWTGGAIALAVFPPTAGVTFDLVVPDETAKRYYVDEAGAPTGLDLTETTLWGRGAFVELSPGEHEVEFGGNPTNCIPGLAWPGDAANRITVPVRVGYISNGSMHCD